MDGIFVVDDKDVSIYHSLVFVENPIKLWFGNNVAVFINNTPFTIF